MASRARPRPQRDALEPPWWFDLICIVLLSVCIVLLAWPAGWAAHQLWTAFLNGWQAV